MKGSRSIPRTVAGGFLAALVLMASPLFAMDKVVVGYQPYDTISYQVAVNQEMGFWKKYFPKGVEVEFQPALQGSIIANNLLAESNPSAAVSCRPRWRQRNPNRPT